MFGNITDLPTLFSYAEALEHYESITPIRGSKNLRPICTTHNGRRKKHMQIIKTTYPKALGMAATPQGAIDAVACRLYDTDVITFVSNGDIIIDNGGYATNSTHSFIDGMFNRGFYTSRQLTAYSKAGSTVIEVYPPQGKKLVVMGDKPVTIRKVEDTREVAYDFTEDVDVQKGYYLKRKVMGEKRKEVDKFRKFALACAKMIDPEQYRLGKVSLRPLAAEDVYAYMVDQDQWNDAFEALIYTSINSDYFYYTRRRDYSVNLPRLRRLMDDVLKYVHCEELFEARDTNNPLSNDNAKYMQGGESIVV
tara:strand:+ start:210 stop:1130 length:921 start_codon:yes stop_codon:yes gene_type:complete